MPGPRVPSVGCTASGWATPVERVALCGATCSQLPLRVMTPETKFDPAGFALPTFTLCELGERVPAWVAKSRPVGRITTGGFEPAGRTFSFTVTNCGELIALDTTRTTPVYTPALRPVVFTATVSCGICRDAASLDPLEGEMLSQLPPA